MRIDFTFTYEDIYVCISLEYGQEAETYIAWIERLKIFCYWMAHNADR